MLAFALHLRCSYVGYIYVEQCYIFFLDWSFDHYVVSLFVFFPGLRRRQWQPTSVLLPGKSHGQRLLGWSPWRHWESDMAEWFHFHALEKEMATRYSVLAWRITGMGESGWLPPMGSYRVGYDWSDLAAATTWPLFQGLFYLIWLLLLLLSFHFHLHEISFPSPSLPVCMCP